MRARDILTFVSVYYRTIFIVLTPIIALPITLCIPTGAAACGYALIIMAVYWITEALPLPVTALLPLILFPMLGILETRVVASKYIADSSITFLGGMIVALAIEKSQLHKRLALKILVFVGSKPASIAIGFMLPTWFLSMWISNTATTAMMITVVQSVIDKMTEAIKNKDKNKNKNTVEMACNNKGYELDESQEEETYFGNEVHTSQGNCIEHSSNNLSEVNHVEKRETKSTVVDMEHSAECEQELEQLRQFAKMLCLTICYSSNIGGLATLTGTPTNLLIAEVANVVFKNHGFPAPITYTTWLMYGLPHAIICLVFMWASLQLIFLSWRSFCFCCKSGAMPGERVSMEDTVKTEYEKLGPITFYEVMALIALIVVVVLWFFRDPGFAPGYAELFKSGYVSDAVPAMIVCILLFIVPSQRPKRTVSSDGSIIFVPSPALLDWQTVSTKLPWGPIILLGGGYALADACQVSGLSKFIGEQLQILQGLPAPAMVTLIITIVTFFTNVTSNAAVVSIVSPILIAMADNQNLNPLFLLLPTGMAATCAFMLPVATPPNAIVFAYGHLKVVDMIKAGFTLNILCILIIAFGIHTWGLSIFNLEVLPWASSVNTTLVSNITAAIS